MYERLIRVHMHADINRTPSLAIDRKRRNDAQHRFLAAQLIRQLADPCPKDSSITGQLGAYRNLAARWTDWDEVRSVCQQLAADMLEAEV